MKTRVIAVVHSHVKGYEDKGVVDLSNDVFAVQTQKAIKGSGGVSLTLVPRRNYLNLIFPNDVINVYFDPGDGERGFVRTFFGYVDRVERAVTTDDKGATSTTFRVTCTDMTKAFDRTEIYFNPNLSNRADLLDTRFGSSLLAGHALRTRGIRAHGTPSDMIENLAALLLGFGAQWKLPDSYVSSSHSFVRNRQRRLNRTKARVPTLDINAAVQLGADPSKLTELSKKLDDATQQINELVAKGGVPNFALAQLDIYKKAVANLLEGSMALNAFNTVSAEINGGYPFTILDLIDLSFIEAMSIDGYIASAAIWTKQGSLASLMAGYSNEIVNELFYDLRPIALGSVEGLEDSCFGQNYSHASDELGINVNGFGNFSPTKPGVQYAPAIVMREYPYSTVEGIDLSLLHASDVGGFGTFVPFGPVFSLDVNPGAPTRAIYDYNDVNEVKKRGGLSPNSKLFEPISRPLKHLDVIPIRSQDVKEEAVGRSDNDVFNMFAIYAEDALQKSWKFLLQDLFPVVTPVSIERNGLRVMELSTMFANYSQENLVNGSAVDGVAIRQNLTRWAFLLDHWNQHNAEYLSGEITLRGMPEIRVGYRVDYVDRQESYYVEEVSHNWQYPDTMTTKITVSRGQRNNPMPGYVPPSVARDFGAIDELKNGEVADLTKFLKPVFIGDTGEEVDSISGGEFGTLKVTSFATKGGGDRTETGRLGKYFFVNPTHATTHSTQNQSGDRSVELENYLDKNSEFNKTKFAGAMEYSLQEGSANRNSIQFNTGERVVGTVEE